MAHVNKLENPETPWFSVDAGIQGLREMGVDFIMSNVICYTSMIQKTYSSLTPHETGLQREYSFN